MGYPFTIYDSLFMVSCIYHPLPWVPSIYSEVDGSARQSEAMSRVE